MSRTRTALGFTAVLGLATVAGWSAGLLHPDAAPTCGGNQAIVVAPYSCGQVRTIDGTTFTVALDVTPTTVTVHYSLGQPRPIDTPIRVRSHAGLSNENGAPVSEVASTIPAGSTTAVLSTRLDCGQIDVKAVFTGNGDHRGRVTAPYVTNATNCEHAPPTTVPATTTPASTVPGSTVPTTAPPSGGTVPTTSPVSGPGTHSTSIAPNLVGAQLAATGSDLWTVLAIIGLVLFFAAVAVVASRMGAQR